MTAKIAYLTAGAGGMFCGSCLHDNTLARALIARGLDVVLTPTYTPIRTDEENVSIDRVFFGGVNVYLQQKSRLFSWLPRFVSSWLDRPSLLNWAASRGMQMNPRFLGELTVSMLRGRRGRQRKEVDKLCGWLTDELQPDLVLFTNILIAGAAEEMRRRLDRPLIVTLQGDDIFLQSLEEPYRSQALAEIGGIARHVDGFLTSSRYYSQFMQDYLGLPADRFFEAPLGLDVAGFPQPADSGVRSNEDAALSTRPLTIGYMARLAPEKGLHVLVDAFALLRRRPGLEDLRLRAAGWLGEEHRGYAEEQLQRARAASADEHVTYDGEVDRQQKIDLLSNVDVLAAPSVYRDPKGLYVLEAAAAGVPAVAPRHGAFPELLETLGGGLLCEPEDPGDLANKLEKLLLDQTLRRTHAACVQQSAHQQFNADAMAAATWETLQRFL